MREMEYKRKVDKRLIGKSKKLLISSNIAVLVLNVGIVIFKIQKIFSFFIVNILHKSIDLTGREKIWNRVLYWVMQKPIMGYGYETSEILQKKFMLTDGSYFHFAHCHNFLLQMWEADKFKPLISGIVNACLNIILIQKIGINGVVISTVIAFTFIERRFQKGSRISGEWRNFLYGWFCSEEPPF